MNTLTDVSVIGAGGYGVVVNTNEDNIVLKLFYDIDTKVSSDKLQNEAKVQKLAYSVITNVTEKLPIRVKVPQIYDVFNNVKNFNLYFDSTFDKKYKLSNNSFLCGISMEKVQPLKIFDESDEQIHICLGSKNTDELNKISNQIFLDEDRPTRGYFANSSMIKTILEELNSDISIEDIAYSMGVTMKTLILNKIIPIDIEWILSRDINNVLCIYIIDFGLAYISENINDKTLEKFYNKSGYDGLADDIYVPHNGDIGYLEFKNSYHNLNQKSQDIPLTPQLPKDYQ